MAKAIRDDFKTQLKKFSELLKDQETIEEAISQANVLPSIPDPYGVTLEQDSGMEKTRVFQSKFSQKDVEYFLKLLKSTNPTYHRNNLETIISEGIYDWKNENPRVSPIEPFLWALKFTDNYIGASVQSNANPQPWILEAISNALSENWDENKDINERILKNVLFYWDWYQPIHVMLCVYKNLQYVNNFEIDNCIRNQWLYRALYSTTAFNCLCSKRKNPENIRSLMLFVSQDKQQDLNFTDMYITKNMRTTLKNYLENSTKDEFAIAQTIYHDSLYNCSKKARAMFDELFGKREKEVQEFILDWENIQTDEEKFLMIKRVSNLLVKHNEELITRAANSRLTDLINEVIYAFKQQTFGFNTQFMIRSFAKNARNCRQYQYLITELYNRTKDSFNDDASFVYRCGYCQMGHPELLPGLFESFYIMQSGIQNGKFIFLNLRTAFSLQFHEEINRLVYSCKDDLNKSLSVIRACSKIYNTQSIVTMYPPEFDALCNRLFEEVKKEKVGYSARFATELMNIYERIVNIQNRERYTKQLQYIATNTQLTELIGAKKRASKLLESLYRPL